MKRLWFAALAVLLLLPLSSLAASCGDDEDEGPAIELQQRDRDQIVALAKSYVEALQARDMQAARSLVLQGVPEATITKSMDTVRDEGFTLVSVGEPTASGQDASVPVNLTDKKGSAVTRELEFRLANGSWVVYSPHLKPLT
jgi:hypothetical protein